MHSSMKAIQKGELKMPPGSSFNILDKSKEVKKTTNKKTVHILEEDEEYRLPSAKSRKYRKSSKNSPLK